MNSIAWLIVIALGAMIGLPALGAALYSLTTEKAHDMIWTPLRNWVAAHPLLFRTGLVLIGCRIVAQLIGLFAWAGLILWIGLLIWKHWSTPWVLPAWRWLVARVQGARPYRYEGERATHEEQAQQTAVSLSLMASADDSPEQTRMATEIEDDAERRLAVLLGKSILSLEEKRERDAIQRALRERRQSFDAPAPRPLFSMPSFSIGGPIHWYAIAALALGIGGQELRVRSLKGDVREVTQERDQALQFAANQQAIAEGARRDVDAVRIETQQSLELIEEARAREARLAARRQARREQEAASGAGNVDYSDSLRDFTIQPLVSGPAASGDPAERMPSTAAEPPAS